MCCTLTKCCDGAVAAKMSKETNVRTKETKRVEAYRYSVNSVDRTQRKNKTKEKNEKRGKEE